MDHKNQESKTTVSNNTLNDFKRLDKRMEVTPIWVPVRKTDRG